MNYAIRLARNEDLPEILKIYSGAREFMAKNGNPNQWGKTNPPLSQLEKDIQEGNLYVAETDGTIHGVFAFLLGQDPTYREILGSWGSDAPYGTIHRIASDGSGGIFHACVVFCSGIIPYLRVDTHEKNTPMQRAILREGFLRRGIIHIADGTPRIAYDRLP